MHPDVTYHAGDISNQQQMSDYFGKISPRVVFHVAAPKYTDSEEVLRQTNIDGTRILLRCASHCPNTVAFVYTGTDSAIEQAPNTRLSEDKAVLYTEKSNIHNPYAKTKAIADAEVICANDPPKLYTAVIRIAGLYGENDDNCMGSLLNTIKKNQHKVQVGDNKRKFEFVYVAKACEAHILAAKALVGEAQTHVDTGSVDASGTKSGKVNGEAFFISDDVSLPHFSEDSTMLLMGIFPSLIAPKGYAGRERIVKGFQEYFSSGAHELGSDLIKGRFNSLTAYNIPIEDIARMEACNGFGILINTLPTAFWCVYHMFSDLTLLAMIRELTLPLLSKTKTDTGHLLYKLDVRKIRTIPLLISLVHETLRFHSSGAATRMVMEDFALGKYVLKKDAMLLVPNREIHFHEDTWGPNLDSFDPFRFMKKEDAVSKKPPPGAFRGFGSGVNMCPGKNFATLEILSVVAMMALRFDVTPRSKTGSWVYPKQDGKNMSTVICSPLEPVPVHIKPREGLEKAKWCFKASGI